MEARLETALGMNSLLADSNGELFLDVDGSDGGSDNEPGLPVQP
jgi:hypothetical protein